MTTTTAPAGYVSRIFNQMTDAPECLNVEHEGLRPQLGVNKAFGACGCWICKRADIPHAEAQWLLDALARHVVRMPVSELYTWHAEYALRHGTINTNALHAALARHGLVLPDLEVA